MANRSHKYTPGHFNSFTACISTAMVLVLVGIIIFFSMMASAISRSVREEFTVEVFLDDSLTTASVQQLMDNISALPYTRQVTYVTKEDATRAMAEDFGINPTEFVGNSPFPATLEVALKAEYTDPDSLKRYMPSLGKASGVTDVIYPENLMEEVSENVRRISLILLGVAVLLGVVSLSLINNTMRLNVARRRHTIQTMKLVGASWGFIRRPFLVQALGMGAVAGLLADLVLGLGFVGLLRWDPNNATLVTPTTIATTLLLVVAVGVGLTLCCAYFSVNKHLAMSRDEAAVY